jgi:hypothetical protein
LALPLPSCFSSLKRICSYCCIVSALAAQTIFRQALRERASGLQKERLIVIYCGCCPWGRCPNIRPAYEQLQSLGFKHVNVLYLANNFGSDWVNKGYPVAKGR